MKKILLSLMAVASVSAYAANPETVTQQVTFETPEAVMQSVSAAESKESNPVIVEDAITRGGTVAGDTTVVYAKKVPFYIGNSNKFYGYGINTTYGIMPLYTKSEFVNYSNEKAGTSYLWTYQYYNKEFLNAEPETTENLTITPTSARQYKAPTLEMGGLTYSLSNLCANSTSYASEMACYKMSQFTSFKEDATKGYYGLAPFNFLECARRSATAAYGIYWSDILMSNDSTNASALTTLKKYYPTATKAFINATAQHIPAAETGYTFNRFYTQFAIDDSTSVPAGRVLGATIYKFIRSGNSFSIEKIGEGKSVVEADIPKGNNGSYYMVNYTVETIDPVTGLSSEGIVVPAGTELLIAINSKDNNYLGFLPLLYANVRTELNIHPVNLYYNIAGENNENLWVPNQWAPGGKDFNGNSVTPANMALWIDPEFDFLYPILDNDDNTVTLPKAGGSQQVYIQSLYDYEDWYINEDEDGTGKIDGWLSYEIAQAEGYCPDVTFTAAATENARKATMTIESVAASVVLTINQGESGVGSVAVEAVSVKTVGGNFEVVVPESVTSVTVYNMAGQVVASQAVEAGANTIDGSALASGVYVVRLSNGTTVKAVK